MGIRGLGSYVTAFQRSCAEHVDLGLADTDDSTHGQEAGGVRRLAVDGLALVYHIMGNANKHRLHLELGCDYGALADAIVEYLAGLIRAGITPMVIMDGMQDREKEATTLLRRQAQVEEVTMLMEHIGVNGVGESFENGSRTGLPSRLSLLPLFAAETLMEACRVAGVVCRVAVREADPELAAACQSFSNRENKKGHGGTSRPDVMGRLGGQGGIDEGDEDWVGSCDAVLSNDSDFLVMDIRGYIPFWALGLGGDGSAGALVFRRPKLASRLGLPADRLPDLACLIGNDWIQADDRVHSIVMGGRAEHGSNTKSNSKTNTNSMHNGRSSRNISTKNSNFTGRRSEPNKRRKGTRGSNSNNVASPPPARDLVEATARFLSQFYNDQRRKQESSTRLEPEDLISKCEAKDASRLGQRAHHDIRAHDRDHNSDIYKNTEGFNLHPESGELESQRSQDGCRVVKLAGQWNGTQGVDPKIQETVAKARRDKETEGNSDGGGEDLLDEFLCLRIFGHCSSSRCQDSHSTKKHDAASAACFISPCEQSSVGDHHSLLFHKQNDKGGGGGGRGKGKSKKGKRGKSSTKHVSITLDGAGDGDQREVRLKELREGDNLGVDKSDYQAFLENFRAAKRHYKIPFISANRRLAERCGGDSKTATSAGFPGGFSAPPELVQAVLEGVFWCRVLIEDAPVKEDTAQATTRHQQYSQGSRRETACCSSLPPSPTTVHSEDASFTRTPRNQHLSHHHNARTKQGRGATGPWDSEQTGDTDTQYYGISLHCSSSHLGAGGECMSPLDGSAFGSFAEVRKRLYELCLALLPDLADGRMIPNVPISSGHQDLDVQQRKESLGDCDTGRTDACLGVGGSNPLGDSKKGSLNSGKYLSARGLENSRREECREDGIEVKIEGSGGQRAMDDVGAGDAVNAGTMKCDDQDLQQGGRWVVKEFRRAGSSVKVVQVHCRIPAALELPRARLEHIRNGGVDRARWELFLSVLGLEDGNNRRLTAFVMAEAEQLFVGGSAKTATESGAGSSKDEGRGERRGRHGLGGVAVVAALLMSTSSFPHVHGEESASRCSLNDGTRLVCCSNEIALAFIAAATRPAHSLSPAFFSDEAKPSRPSREDPGKGNTVLLKTAPGGNTAESLCWNDYSLQTTLEERPCKQDGHRTIPARTDGCGSTGGEDSNGSCRKQVRGSDEAAGKSVCLDKARGEARKDDSPKTREAAKQPKCWVCFGNTSEEKDGSESLAEVDGDVDRRFVSLWSHVQSAVWHANACHSVLGLNLTPTPALTTLGNKQGKASLCIDPLLLRPDLALRFYRQSCLVERRRRQHQRSGPLNGSEAKMMMRATVEVTDFHQTHQEHLAARSPTSTHEHEQGPFQSKETAENHERRRREKWPPADPCDGALKTSNDTGSRGHRNTHEKQQRCEVHGGESSMQLPTSEVKHAASTDRCRGTCAWAQRVRKVMGAAGLC